MTDGPFTADGSAPRPHLLQPVSGQFPAPIQRGCGFDPATRTVAVARGLAARGGELWGWKFQLGDPPQPPTALCPVWTEPAPFQHVLVDHQHQRRMLPISAAGISALALGVWLILTLTEIASGTIDAMVAVAVFAVGMVIVAVRQVLMPQARLREARRDREAAHARYLHRHRQWSQEQQDYLRQLRHYAAHDRWFPLRPLTLATRVDVVGGNTVGWSNLLTTLGCSLLASGHSLLVLDLTGRHITGPVTTVAKTSGFPITNMRLLRDCASGTLLQGLQPADVAEIIAEAIATTRTSSDAGELRVTDADILTQVASCLHGPLSFTRFAAGLRVVRGHYQSSEPNVLTLQELRRLTAQIDLIGHNERTTTALQTLSNLLELLAAEEGSLQAESAPELMTVEGVADPEQLVWPVPGLTVLASRGSHPRRKDFLDRVLFHRMLHELRTRPQTPGRRDVLIVAGADRMGLSSLEALSEEAEHAGVRLVLMLAHLRNDLGHLVGGAGNPTILMRMSNHEDAKVAAEFIGRGHSFQVNQVTDQRGTSDSTGDGRNWGIDHSRSENSSQSWSESTSTSSSRVYEYLVEPAQIQGLSATGVIMVEHGTQGPHVVIGDCNPEIVLMPRVAYTPQSG